MNRDTLHTAADGIHEQATARRLRASLLAVGLCIVLAVSLVPVAPVAAQTNNETIPQCDEGPPIPGQEEGAGAELEVALATDRSNSMDLGTRLEDAKSASTGFVGRLEDPDEAAAVSFAGDGYLDQELTTDHSAVSQAIDGLQTEANTFMGAGIDTAHTELVNGTNATDGATKAMVVLTDATSVQDQPRPEASEAKADGITIFAVGVGDNVNQGLLNDIATSEDHVYVSPDSEDLDSIYEEITEQVEELQTHELTIDTRQLFQPAETHDYRVTNTTTVNNQSTTEDVTDEASVNTSNTSLLTANEQAAELTATDDANASDGVVVTASHGNETGCVNAIVASASMENLELLPTIWRGTTFLGNWTVFFLLLASLTGVVGTRLATSFMGLSMMELVLIIGWFGGYLSTGLVMTSVFACLFIGLNLAANIDYQVQR